MKALTMENNYEVVVPIVVNSDKFREAALHFTKFGYYTAAPRGTTEYKKYWDRELYRCVHGFTSDDGEFISGYFYFYLNYSRIIITKEEHIIDSKGKSRRRAARIESFPDFYDYDWAYFNAIEEAENEGKHMVVLKKRGAGYSYKGASMLNRNFYCIPKSKSYAIASEMEFLTKDGLLTKAWDMMNFIDTHTAFGKKRQKIDRATHKRASFVYEDEDSGVKIEAGWGSEIIGISLKNDAQKARGKRGKLILWEEAGKFPNLKQAWQIARPSVEDGNIAFGLMVAYGTGGCVCAGTKVWDKTGNLVNIEDLRKEDGILGYDSITKNISHEHISWMQPPNKKACLKLKTNTGRELRCSVDHPILCAIQDKITKGKILNQDFVEAVDIKIGNKIAVIDNVSLFGNKSLWQPRLVGWLIGDGSYAFNSTPRLSNCEVEINDWIKNNTDFKVSISRLTKDGKLYEETYIKGITKNLRELGIFAQTKLNKRLPIDTHKYCKSSICELLGGLFDTDGYVNLRFNKKRNTPIAEISISQASLELLEEIRLLLQKLGIHGRIRTRLPRKNNPKDKNKWYEFTIADKRSLLNFIDNISLYPKEKQRRLNLIKEHYKNIKASVDHPGIRWEKIIEIENIGLQNIYNLTADNTNTYLANGIITHNTVGADYEGLKELFYEPNVYNALPFKNTWDESPGDKPCGFFVPWYYNMSGADENGVKFIDKDGNSNLKIGIRWSLKERDKLMAASDKNTIDIYIAERPFTPEEATLQISGNLFPKKELLRHLNDIRTSKSLSSLKQVGELRFNDKNELKWALNPRLKDHTSYRLDKGKDKSGAIVIWEHPNENPPFGLYIGGLDPYDHDSSTTDSLGSLIIYKRFQDFENYYDLPVAEYTGRPESAEEFYENCRKLAMYYNATVLYENEKLGIFTYFTQKHSDYLLADQPDLIKNIVSHSRVSRGKGIHMSKEIKAAGETMVRDWLNEEFAPGRKNLTKIFSEPLLEELISFNLDGNFDRVIAFMLVMIYKQELYNHTVKKREDTIKKELFAKPLFKYDLDFEL